MPERKLIRRTLSVVLDEDKAGRVSENARERRLKTGDVIAEALKPITEYEHDDVVFVTVAIPKEAYRDVKHYSEDDWVWDELMGRGIEHLRKTGTAMRQDENRA